MKQLKKTFVALAIAFATFTVSAQTSNTSTATRNLFKTDVDYFMDVNDWNKVQPANGFGYFGLTYNSYDLGFAKQFDKFYWGTYFTGDFGNYSKTVEKSGSETSVNTKEGDTDSTSFSFYNLFGFDNIGLRFGGHYYNYNSSTVDNATEEKETDKASFTLAAEIGLTSATFANHEVQPFANVNFQWNHYHYLSNLGYSGYGSKVVTTTKASKTTVTTDDRTWYLSGNVGGIFTLSKDDVKETYLTTSLSAYVENPINKDEKENAYGYKYSDFKISLPVTYKVIYKATEKLSVGARTGITTSFNSKTTDKDNSSTEIGLSPYVYTGLQYDTLKKVVLNAGVSFAVPGFTYTTAKNSASDTTTATSTWDGIDARVSFKSGFQFNPVKNLSFDCDWGILSGVLGSDLTTDFKEGDGTDATPVNNDIFWQNVNKAFVHNISFIVSYKF